MKKYFEKLKTLLNALKLIALLIALIELIIAGSSIIYMIRNGNIGENELNLLYSLLNCNADNLTTVLLTTLITSALNFASIYLGYHWLKMSTQATCIFDKALAKDLKRLAIITFACFIIHLIITAIIYAFTQVDNMSNLIPLFPISLIELIFYYLIEYGYEIKVKGE